MNYQHVNARVHLIVIIINRLTYSCEFNILFFAINAKTEKKKNYICNAFDMPETPMKSVIYTHLHDRRADALDFMT